MNKKGVYNKKNTLSKEFFVALSNKDGVTQTQGTVVCDCPKSAVYVAIHAFDVNGSDVRVCRDNSENRLRYADKILMLASVVFNKPRRFEPTEVGYIVRWR